MFHSLWGSPQHLSLRRHYISYGSVRGGTDSTSGCCWPRTDNGLPRIERVAAMMHFPDRLRTFCLERACLVKDTPAVWTAADLYVATSDSSVGRAQDCNGIPSHLEAASSILARRIFCFLTPGWQLFPMTSAGSDSFTWRVGPQPLTFTIARPAMHVAAATMNALQLHNRAAS